MLKYVLETKASLTGSPKELAKAESRLIRLLKLAIAQDLVSKIQNAKSKPRYKDTAKFLLNLFSGNSNISINFINTFAKHLCKDSSDKVAAEALKYYVIEEANKSVSVVLKSENPGAFTKFKKGILEKLGIVNVKTPLRIPKLEEFENYVRSILMEIKQDMDACSFSSVAEKEKKCRYLLDRILRREFKKNTHMTNFLKYVLKRKKKDFINSIVANAASGTVSEMWVGDLSKSLPKRLLKGLPEFKSMFLKDSLQASKKLFLNGAEKTAAAKKLFDKIVKKIIDLAKKVK